ncbi:MAG: hypothetical protein COB38_09890 [Gammaproteobacteria bacterium]|nr:MAG: hypothetical protein COB38_09890 [Gammaproteobacteria bacterium]
MNNNNKTNSSLDSKSNLYWKENIKLIFICLSIWFIVSFGFGIIWVDWLNQFRIAGFKLGFWFAQQGSIYTFLLLIFFYINRMNKLDSKYSNKPEQE